MKIVHIAPNSPYNDYWGYQDNLLPKYHRKAGHDVTVITTNTMHKDGRIVEIECADYYLNDGVRVVRMKRKKYPISILTNINARMLVYTLLTELMPDFVFYHGLVSSTIYDVVRYKKRVNPACVIVQDNHLDYNIGRKFETLKEKILRAFYRHVKTKTIKYVDKVYGVTPWRKKYAEDYYQVPTQKTDVLIMGADDEKIDFVNSKKIRSEIRELYSIAEKDFLIVTGGKIDQKKKIDVLLEACKGMENVKLLIFGQVNEDIRRRFDLLLKDSENCIYIGWINAEKVYDYFFAADLVFFPGQHSVLWEQACATKVPCVFEKWEGMDHVNNGGNSKFVSDVNIQNIKDMIECLKYTEEYFAMKAVAESEATDIFLYSRIAEKSLECARK